MPYNQKVAMHPCTICGGAANALMTQFQIATVVDCEYCGDYSISHELARDKALPLANETKRALARYLIRQMNQEASPDIPFNRPAIASEFFNALAIRNLPSPSEVSDNLLLYLARVCDNRPGKRLDIMSGTPDLIASIGVVDGSDVSWTFQNLHGRGQYLLQTTNGREIGRLSGIGWERIAELRKSSNNSRFAFFARKFDNPQLDQVYDACLIGALAAVGFELRTVTQKAGLVDAIIEDEIRRCAFVLADLSDDNAGAYWEAGFAEGLGKPVIYLCKLKDGEIEKRTHFDADHRHTVRWDIGSLDRTAENLKAVIRNTLLGKARQ